MTDPNDHPFNAPDERFEPDHGQPAPPPNPLLLVHRRLRGRYKWAVTLGLLLAAPCAVAGWFAMPVQYASQGVVEVRTSVDQILYDIQENRTIPLIDQMVENERQRLVSQQNLTRAAQNPQLQAAGWPALPAGTSLLQQSLEANKARWGTYITVSVVHEDPRLSQLATNAVLSAYFENYETRMGTSAQRRETALQGIVQTLTRELSAKRNEMFTLSNNYGAETLPRRLDTKSEELANYDRILTQFDMAIAEARSRESGDGEAVPAGYTVEELALQDPELANLVAARDELLARQETLRENLLPNHRTMRELQRQIDEVLARIDARAQTVAGRVAAEEGLTGGGSVEQLEARRDRYREERNAISAEVNDLGRSARLLQAARMEMEDLERRLDEASTELNRLRTERQNLQDDMGRVEIIEGELPLSPSRDKRIPLAIGGAGAGLAIGFGAVFLYGLARPTYRFIDEVEGTDRMIPLLGTLPDFSSGDPEQRDMAALSVHHLRNALQLGPGKAGGRVLTITSASAGDGKTSLTMALGTSYAAAGQRTCLLDSDMVGRGLSRELQMTRQKGFAQAVATGDINGLAVATPVANLWTVPAGLQGDIDPTRLSERNVAPVIDALRKQFDVVLIDTGPMLGSLEANVVSALSDRVVMAVSRGQSARIVHAAIDRLKRIGVPCAGIVFNRATPMDFRSSVSHASIRSTSFVVRPGEEHQPPRPGSRASLMEAVAGAVQPESNGEA
jgi:Mrp family chromosome partitioning ATPase/uncharacterized protein involved in exopolysaccharide biosynthesis